MSQSSSSSSSSSLPVVYLTRHGETEWSLSGQHTSRTDIPLTPKGERNAIALGTRLKTRSFAAILSSPRIRARRTCELAGFGAQMKLDEELTEWDYGEYEGLTTREIRQRRPNWQIFRDGAPGGESPKDVAARADRVIGRLRAIDGDVLIFTHGHFGRVLGARWVGGLDVAAGALLLLSAGSISMMSYDHNREEPALKLWNDTCHLG
jgi:probable phosphoglycerate mutase